MMKHFYNDLDYLETSLKNHFIELLTKHKSITINDVDDIDHATELECRDNSGDAITFFPLRVDSQGIHAYIRDTGVERFVDYSNMVSVEDRLKLCSLMEDVIAENDEE